MVRPIPRAQAIDAPAHHGFGLYSHFPDLASARQRQQPLDARGLVGVRIPACKSVEQPATDLLLDCHAEGYGCGVAFCVGTNYVDV
jgi:hypothetical protein